MTFVSPFDSLGDKSKIDNEEWELYTGSFGCQNDDCWNIAVEAKHYPNQKLLVWSCKDGHISRIEDYNG
jgi:hypothetical protein